MTHLTPCRFCEDVPELEVRRPTATVEFHYARHDCRGPYRATPEAAAAEWNAENSIPVMDDNTAPAPALLALATFGARVLQAGLSPAGFAVGLTGSAIGGAGEAAGAIVYDKDDMARMAPGIASAIAALLALAKADGPGGAGEVAP